MNIEKFARLDNSALDRLGIDADRKRLFVLYADLEASAETVLSL